MNADEISTENDTCGCGFGDAIDARGEHITREVKCATCSYWDDIYLGDYLADCQEGG